MGTVHCRFSGADCIVCPGSDDQRREFVFSYVGMLGAYSVLTKTGLLFAVLLAVSAWKPVELVEMILCMIHAVLMAAAVYSVRKYWYVGGLWAAVIVVAILLLGSGQHFGGIFSDI